MVSFIIFLNVISIKEQMENIKREIRVLGIDDAPHDKYKGDKETLVIATFFRGGHFMDGVLSTKATIDGSDSTEKLIKMVMQSKFHAQLQCIMLDGIAVGGFNVIDIQKLSDETKIPVIVVIRDFPDFEKIIAALKKLGMDEKIGLIKKAGEVTKISNVYVQLVNISKEKAEEIIRVTAIHSFIPEPIRAAHIIASGIILGESRGKV